MQKHNLSSSLESENVDIFDKLSSCKKLSKKGKKPNEGIHETTVIFDCNEISGTEKNARYNHDSI